MCHVLLPETTLSRTIIIENIAPCVEIEDPSEQNEVKKDGQKR